MQVNVQLRQDLAEALHASPSDSAAAPGVRSLVEETGGTLRPVHPGTSDPNLARHFVVELPAGGDPDAMAHRLRACEGVEGAWTKPAEEPP